MLTADKWREFTASLPDGEAVQRARELNHQYDAGLLTVTQFLDQVEEVTGRRASEIEHQLDNETTKNTQLLEYIATLKPQYKIGLLSNIGTNWIRDSFLTSEEQRLFDEMVLSFEVGTTKPDPRIYQLACEKLDIEPSEAIFTDDITEYCEAARAIGMQAVHYQHFTQLKTELESILNHK